LCASAAVQGAVSAGAARSAAVVSQKVCPGINRAEPGSHVSADIKGNETKNYFAEQFFVEFQKSNRNESL
jgi:hypothetical protein